MTKLRLSSALLGVLLVSPAAPSPIPVQSSGSRGGVFPVSGSNRAPVAPDRVLDDFAAEHYIAIQGSAEVRVVPTEIRVVLAHSVEGSTAADCHESASAKIEELAEELLLAGVSREQIVVDFIALLPRYAWDVETRGTRQVAVERRSGYVLQTNIHLSVDSEALAQRAVAGALKLEITDILAFDYWSRDLDARKQEAQRLALEEARRKSDLLLAMFHRRPDPINVHESTRVLPPRDLYLSVQNDLSETFQVDYSGKLPQLFAPRPKNTYYYGPPGGTDIESPSLPMQPEISVVSEVTLYYAAPMRPAGMPRGDSDQR